MSGHGSGGRRQSTWEKGCWGRERNAHTQRGAGTGRGLGCQPWPRPLRGSDGLHVVGGEHARVTRALHRAVHPPVVDLLHVDDGVAILEGDFVFISRVVVVDSAETLLRGERGQRAQTLPMPCPRWAEPPSVGGPGARGGEGPGEGSGARV